MIKRVLHWLDNNILQLLAGFLLVFIPLYPKIPLLEAIPGYLVRVRLEDFFVLLTIGIYGFQLIRKKVSISFSPVTIGILTYLAIGLLSVLTSVFVVKTVPPESIHVVKTVLHWLRRIEYFSLFFIFFGSIKSFRQTKIYVLLFFATLFLVTLYGYGQKYLYFPAFSTMNREFAKGWALYLTEHARVLSTFGGHYDLAGYLVIVLTLCWSFLLGTQKVVFKILIGVLLAGGFWLLILTASRISFISYLIGLTVVIFLWAVKRGVRWGITRWLIATFLSLLVMLSFGDLSDRFLRILRIQDRVGGIQKLVLSPFGIKPTTSAVFLENNLAAVTSKSDQPPTPIVPADVTGAEPQLLVATISAQGERILVPRERTYSQTALMFDLSTAIRLDATWPRAIASFRASPLLGTGYATLTKARVEDFTEAESTDSDYFRALGETGLLGFLAFFGTLGLMGYFALLSLRAIKEPFLYSLTSGFIGLLVGLAVNASYIDIFEASKVAYMFWAIAGITFGSLFLIREQIAKNRESFFPNFYLNRVLTNTRAFFQSNKFIAALLITLSILPRLYKLDLPLADWHSWRQADTSAVTRNFVRYHQVNWLYPTYDDLSSIPSGKPNPQGYRFVEFPIYNAVSFLTKESFPELSVEEAGRVVTALASTLAVIFLYLILRQLISHRVGFLSALVYALLPYSIYYGRVILPDPSMVASSLGAIWFSIQFSKTNQKRFFLVSVILAASALLIKPFAIFLLSPIIYIWFVNFGLSKKLIFVSTFYFLLSTFPFVLWRFWISQFPEGIPANLWLLNSDGIRFKGAFWYWLFADRIGRLILGYWGLILLGFGLTSKLEGKYRHLPLILFVSCILYLVTFATGNVRHDYYQILLLPSLSIFVGLGLDKLLSDNWRSRLLAVVCSLFALGFGWYFVRDYYNINHPEIVEAGRRVSGLTDWRSLVVAPYDGDTAFLYQTDRHGWPVMEGTIEQMITKGAQYYVSVRFDQATEKLLADSEPWQEVKVNRPKKKYNLLVQNDKYVIIQLVPNDQLPK